MYGERTKLAINTTQTRVLETTLETLHKQSDNPDSLPPLMNPAMLEASDDLTNLSHLNEPAGMSRVEYSSGVILTVSKFSKPSSYATCRKRFIHTAG